MPELEIKATSRVNLSVTRPRQTRKVEDVGAVSENWERTFGNDCAQCGGRHVRHTECPKGDDG